MPQLDLTWFIINFLIAWTLITIVLFLLLNQNFETNSQQENTENTNLTKNENTQWLW
uniref:ATP synthase complex subunit 8 n=1 Tax=Actinopyga lecanora TaxID=571811 RepID=A0A7U1ARG4_9ECHN|nr:ATP synthase F0 subunit 8 [Actinopyga lecanora]QQY85561.1 ATP synthase subunit 8 [Actinopyga lecanora]QWE50457.1 ATP synthase F0 subunit 8 [Actinopyga lecanora]